VLCPRGHCVRFLAADVCRRIVQYKVLIPYTYMHVCMNGAKHWRNCRGKIMRGALSSLFHSIVSFKQPPSTFKG